MNSFQEFSNWAVGLGIVTMALFPLALPIVILTAVVLVPLLLPLVALALIAVPILLVRRLLRGRRALRRKRSGPQEGDRSLRVGGMSPGRAG